MVNMPKMGLLRLSVQTSGLFCNILEDHVYSSPVGDPRKCFYTLNSVTGTGHAKYERSFPTCIIPEDSNVKKGTPHALLMASPHNTSEGVIVQIITRPY